MRNVLHGNTFNGNPLSNSSNNDQGFYHEILQSIEHLMQHMTQRHGKVFFTMFVLKYPANSAFQYPNDNALLSRFIEALMLNCRRRGYDPKYLWVREYSSNGQPHYHIMILLNSDVTQNAHGILSKATELWQGCLGVENASGLVHLCLADEHDRYGGVKIIRNSPDFQQVYGQCFERASYLAKTYSKGNSPAYVNGFGCSRLR
jgi:hypothetical protein